MLSGEAAWYAQYTDACGVCSGDNSTCLGCDGTPNSGTVYDACGDCRKLQDEAFNTTCADCAGEPNGPRVVDECDECNDPADTSKFSRRCAGCDGVPNSGLVRDECGECAGDSYSINFRAYRGSPSDQLPYRCIDCAGVPNGTSYIDLCCGCVLEPEPGERPTGDVPQRPPEAQLEAMGLFDQAGVQFANATALAATWKAHREATLGADPDESKSYAPMPLIDAFSRVTELLDAAWALVYDEAVSDDNTTCYSETFVLRNASSPRDACGVCGGDNATCLGCDDDRPLTDGGLMLDDCGVCGGANGAMDACGVCFGGNGTCRGCDGVPNSGKQLDACGDCLLPDDTAWNGACAGCDGVPHSGAVIDDCGDCSVPGTEAFNAGCAGCDGVPDSSLEYDACCECGGGATEESPCYAGIVLEQDRQRNSSIPWMDAYNVTQMLPLLHVVVGLPGVIQAQPYDACGVCYGNSMGCSGCDGVPNSGLMVDPCGVCGGNCSSCVPHCANQTCVFAGADGAGEEACEVYVPPAPPLTARERKEWLVVAYGHEWGPFSIIELEVGEVPVLDPVSKEPTTYPLSPRIMVGQIYTAKRKVVTQYGNVSQGASQPPSWGQFFDYDANPVIPGGERIDGRPTDPEKCQLQCIVYGCMGSTPDDPSKLCEGEVDLDISRCRKFGDECIIANGLRCDGVKYSWLTPSQQRAVWKRPVLNQDPVRWFEPARCGHLSALQGEGATDLRCDGALTSPCSDRWLEQLERVVVNITQEETLLSHGGYLPMSAMPGLERVVYDACTAATSRDGRHEAHGKRTGLNGFGILVDSVNVTAYGRRLRDTNMPWNPDERYIFDTVDSWHDEACTCSASWVYSDVEPVPPTCPRAWRSWDDWFEYDNVYVADNRRYEYATSRSAASGGWAVSGGWWVQDGGGSERSLRGPFRLGSHGTLELATTDAVQSHAWPAQGDYPSLAHELSPAPRSYIARRPFVDVGLPPGACYRAARLVPSLRDARGALWYPQQQRVTQGFVYTVEFQAVDRSRRCRDVHTLRRDFSSETRTLLHRTCSAEGGEGLALVISGDDARFRGTGAGDKAIGDGGAGLGYGGLLSTLAIELDSWADVEAGEPPGEHIAVHASTEGTAVLAAHSTRQGAALVPPTIGGIADGKRHTVRVAYRPGGVVSGAGGGALMAALEAGAWNARAVADHFIAGAEAGSLDVFLDDLSAPLLTLPLSLQAVLGPDRARAWVGLTAATGARFQAIDVFSVSFTSGQQGLQGE